jgi:hypothetical protein
MWQNRAVIWRFAALFYVLSDKRQIKRSVKASRFCYNGEGGIRTRGRDEPYTAFPRLLLKPLGHLSRDFRFSNYDFRLLY